MNSVILAAEGGYQEFELLGGEWAILLFSGLAALLAIAVGFVLMRGVLAAEQGTPKMIEIAVAIQEGAWAYLKRQFRTIAVILVPLAVIVFITSTEVLKPDDSVALTFAQSGTFRTLAFIAGCFMSGLTGYIGMTLATRANVRTAAAAKKNSLPESLKIAFRAGGVAGMFTVGLGLLGATIIIMIFQNTSSAILVGFGFGGSLLALFLRVGGGIFTKAADVGADLVGKVEAGIPEDDPRNPATIADNVGDNVGDVAGMGADLFESYSGSIIAPIALAAFIPGIVVAADMAGAGDAVAPELFLFPLAIAAVGMVASILGAFTVKSSGSTNVHELSKALHRGTNVAALLTVVGVFGLGLWMLDDSDVVQEWWGLPIAVVGGLAVGYAIGKVAEIWTSDAFGPVKKIAQQSETGPATTILGGISAGMVSVAASVILVAVGIGVAYWGGEQAAEGLGIYGIAVAAIGMLATTGVVVSVDAYGPIADNAGGIAEMAHLDPSVREVTDSLDSLGNTTAAVAKGFAVGSAALTALALFKAFEASLFVEGHSLDLNVGQVEVFIGLFLGAMLPFLFASLTIDAVGRAANKMIEEVRRQFREIPGLREGADTAVPEYAKCVDISTAAALREMLIPGGLAIVVPLVIGFIDVDALGGFLAGSLVVGFCLAIFMANAGGAWDNAKKYIEAGNHGGKGSDPHKAAVVGDTVGDPFKDTSGPAMNILIKVMTIVSLIFASAFV